MFLNKSVAVKMLPFDNKNEFQVIVDMPEGTSLERTDMVIKELSQYIRQSSFVNNFQTYTGTASPITFNGLVRHYDLRNAAHMADIQVNLTNKGDRKEQSHYISSQFRPSLQAIGNKFGANIKVVEVPPGPPVLSTLVAEVYGPDHREQIKIARQIKEAFSKVENVVDVDWMVESDQKEYKIKIDREKAMLNGISTSEVVNSMNLILSERPIGKIYKEKSNQDVSMVIQLEDKEKSRIEDVLQLKLKSKNGSLIPVTDLVSFDESIIDKSIMRKKPTKSSLCYSRNGR